MRRERSRIRIDVADFGRPNDLPFREARGDLVPLRDVARAYPFPGAPVAVAEGKKLEAGSRAPILGAILSAVLPALTPTGDRGP